MANQWEYHISRLPIERDGPWIESADHMLDGLGGMGYEAVLVIERGEDHIHILFKRPRTNEPPVLPAGAPVTSREW